MFVFVITFTLMSRWMYNFIYTYIICHKYTYINIYLHINKMDNVMYNMSYIFGHNHANINLNVMSADIFSPLNKIE